MAEQECTAMDPFRLLLAAIRDKNVASVASTSFTSVRQICKAVDWRRPMTFVEYGPGTGAFTKFLLKRLHPDSTLLAIERNRKLATRLRRFSRRRPRRTPRLIVVWDDARNVQQILQNHGCGLAEYVLSGIPFSFIPLDAKREIIQRTYDVLAPGGMLLVYQITFHVRPYLQEVFGAIRSSRALLNVPPLCVMTARKPKSSSVELEFDGQRLQSAALVDASQR
jgi:phospholipid N-methyltransferase